MNTKDFVKNKGLHFSKEEYVKVNGEMQKRIEMIFSQGFSLVSMVTVLWTLTITVLGITLKESSVFTPNSNMWQTFLFGIMISAMCSVPVYLVLPFAVKFRDNLRSVSSLSTYMKIFFDLPSLLGKYKDSPDALCTAWETIHCEVEIPNTRFFSIEYKVASVFSAILTLICGIVPIGFFIANISGRNIVWLSLFVLCLLTLLTVDSIFINRIFRFSKTDDAIKAYLAAYLQKYLRDAVDMGIITETDKENYIAWQQQMDERDKRLGIRFKQLLAVEQKRAKYKAEKLKSLDEEWKNLNKEIYNES